MDPKMSFAERARIGMEILAKQPPVTFEEMRAQYLLSKKKSKSKNKKKRKD